MLKKFKAYIRTMLKEKEDYPPKTITVGDKEYQLRELTVDDVKELLSIEREVYFGELPWTKTAFISELTSPFLTLYLGIFDKEKLFGFVGSRILGLDCHLTNIAVSPSYQRQQIGTYLINEIEKFARNNQCETMSLEVRISNQNAQRLYRKLGFQSRKVKKGYYTENNEDALDMVKILKEE
ncbi:MULTISPECIES: ribosomal protein S18-alanine N-acetyltransferase [unclassified Enterococcus]|uniref:ribosomal protein S18-alanine N-acetyltransferase n=1 Tax=unclassified Enterococcus TaxID=2608891 RepID=UPI001A9B6D9B|nr:ribosomal protein S18-alanine N-acetyltransferase [Enterococcus sp. DIV1271a]MBO1299531.1 ribosomal protein S18-alanine N-acetyltransferase [Enterococcus sp. DIV1271a]